MLTIPRVALVLVAGAAFSPAPRPVGDPLPDEMFANYGGSFAVMLYPGASEGHDEALSAEVSFDTERRVVIFKWRARAATAGAYMRTDEYEVSFQPTALCKHSGQGNKVYVAGYVERTGEVVIEQWVATVALGATAPPGGGAPKTILGVGMQRNVIVATDTIKPVRSLLYFFPIGKLWVFEEEAPHVVWQVDPGTGLKSWLCDTSVIPALAHAKQATFHKVKPTAPDGGGYLVVLRDWRNWFAKLAIDPPKPEDKYFVMRDADFDGDIDEMGQMTVDTFATTKQYVQHFDSRYH